MKLLVSGCSYTENGTWPQFLLGSTPVEILNLGKGGAGNSYIANSVMSQAIDFKPDFVFVLWSGIIRSDFRSPNSYIYNDNSNYRSAEVDNSLFSFSGGGLDVEKGWLAGYNAVKADSWPEITSLRQWFNLPESIKSECLKHKIHLSTDGGQPNVNPLINQYFLSQNLIDDRQYHSELTFQNMMNCFNLLDKLNIPYRFSFIYDIWSKVEYFSLGQAVKEKYYQQVDWSKFIDLPPLRFGLKHDYMSEDNFHLTFHGMNEWAKIISNTLQQDPTLKYLF